MLQPFKYIYKSRSLVAQLALSNVFKIDILSSNPPLPQLSNYQQKNKGTYTTKTKVLLVKSSHITWTPYYHYPKWFPKHSVLFPNQSQLNIQPMPQWMTSYLLVNPPNKSWKIQADYLRSTYFHRAVTPIWWHSTKCISFLKKTLLFSFPATRIKNFHNKDANATHAIYDS